MPTAQSILAHRPDLAALEAVTTPVRSDVVVVGIVTPAGQGDTGDGGAEVAPVVLAPDLSDEARSALATAAKVVGAATKVGPRAAFPPSRGFPAPRWSWWGSAPPTTNSPTRRCVVPPEPPRGRAGAWATLSS